MDKIVSTIMFNNTKWFRALFLYQGIKTDNSHFLTFCLPLLSMLAMAHFLTLSQFNDTLYPVLLSMAGVSIGGSIGTCSALKI